MVRQKTPAPPKKALLKGGQSAKLKVVRPSPSTLNVSTLDYNALKLDLINYKAGNIKNCYATWASITRDKYILGIVQEGLEIDFLNKPEVNHNPCASFSKFDQVIIDKEIEKAS